MESVSAKSFPTKNKKAKVSKVEVTPKSKPEKVKNSPKAKAKVSTKAS